MMAELRDEMHARLRGELLRRGASPALEDAPLYAQVDRILSEATERADPGALLLPELLGDPAEWRLEPTLMIRSHRGRFAAAVIAGVKRRLLLPALRWLFEYSQSNFLRQQRVNHVLFACVQQLAIENAALRRDLEGRGGDGPHTP
ncbi:MAG: hypothetical protein H0X44_05630 [Acidobacteria bacterium]|nr:hypothetical protein [Acidobacteriota bacterium]